MSSEYTQRVADREKWIASVAGEEGAPAERTHLLATAALLHGVVDGITVPDGAEERSQQRALAICAEVFRAQAAPPARSSRDVRPASPPWSHRLGGFLRVVFALGRRR
jgi:hypothetical protein